MDTLETGKEREVLIDVKNTPEAEPKSEGKELNEKWLRLLDTLINGVEEMRKIVKETQNESVKKAWLISEYDNDNRVLDFIERREEILEPEYITQFKDVFRDLWLKESKDTTKEPKIEDINKKIMERIFRIHYPGLQMFIRTQKLWEGYLEMSENEELQNLKKINDNVAEELKNFADYIDKKFIDDFKILEPCQNFPDMMSGSNKSECNPNLHASESISKVFGTKLENGRYILTNFRNKIAEEKGYDLKKVALITDVYRVGYEDKSTGKIISKTEFTIY